jgi:hypothetical protein
VILGQEHVGQLVELGGLEQPAGVDGAISFAVTRSRHGPSGREGRLRFAMPDAVTIDQALDAFLRDQRARLSDRTYRNYEDVIRLLRDSLNSYAYSSLDARDAKRWQKAFDAGDEDAFCHLFGPDEIPPHLGEFLGYFMVRKVSAGQELLKAAGTVTGKLARWLEQHAYIESDAAEVAVDRARDSARELPAAERLTDLLVGVAMRAPDIDVDDVGEDDWVEDQLMIDRVEPGKIWFEGGIGPIQVPKRASEIAQEGWMVFIVAARRNARWHLLEVGSVYP